MDLPKRLLILSGLAALATSTDAGVAPGKPAPDFRIQTLGGKTLTLASLKGKVVILNVWATWCAPCRAEMPAFDAYYKAHKAKGLEIIAISQDTVKLDAKVTDLAKGLSFATAFGRNADIKGYGNIGQVPATFIIDRRGRLAFDGSRDATVFTPDLLARTVTPLLR